MAIPTRQVQVVSYKRIATQCTDAEMQLKKQQNVPQGGSRVCNLARLLLHSIDSHYEDELRRPTVHSRQRGEAKNALSQLRSAVRRIR